MFHAKDFWYKPHNSNSVEIKKMVLNDCIVAFIHVEKTDKDNKDIIGKAAGNIKWLSNKNKINRVVLHSFAHLSSNKSDPETANSIIQRMGEKLKKSLTVHILPFGQFYEFSIHVLGPSLAKVFKEL